MPQRRRPFALALAIGLAGAAEPAEAVAQAGEREIAGEFFLGTAWNLPLPLTLGDGTTGVRIRARYSTRPFADAPYYAYRLGRINAGRGVEAELVHHKLYLENPRPPIEHLEVTHGYNLAMANVVAPIERWRLRVGLGLVVAHPEGRIGGHQIRGARRTLLGGGYHVAGGALQVALGRRFALGGGRVALTVAPEAKLTAALARVPLEQGTLTVPNVALHALGGIGVRRRW